MSRVFRLYREPELHRPRLIIGLPDAGYAGLRVVDYLKSHLAAEEMGRIEPHRFSTVPWVSVSDGVLRELELLRNGFYSWKNPAGGNDLLIFRSEQPTARPYDYVEAILEAARQVGVRRIYLLGAFGALGTTHQDPCSVLGVVNMPRLVKILEAVGVEPYPEYRGAGNIHSSFLWFARSRGLEGIALWTPIPHYVARLPFPWSNYPRASLCLLQKLNLIEGLGVEEEGLEALAGRTDDEMRQVYDQLQEEAKGEIMYPSPEQGSYPQEGLGSMSDEELKGMIRDIEDFFRYKK